MFLKKKQKKRVISVTGNLLFKILVSVIGIKQICVESRRGARSSIFFVREHAFM